MKALFVALVVVVTVTGCSSWGMRSAPSQADEGGTSSITRSPTGVSSHNKGD